MTPADFKRVEHLFRNSKLMGSDSALREFLGLSADHPIPLSISHGVDFGHCWKPMDVDAVEPIHWATNRRVYAAATSTKPAVLAPHPWALLSRTAETPPGHGTLVIGPPPSPANDSALRALLPANASRDCTVLVKARGAYQRSIEHWQRHGFKTITAQTQDGHFYERLHSLLSAFDTIISPTFSSAIVFAASLGKKIVLLRDFAYTAYERADYESEVNLSSPEARRIVRIFASEAQREITDTAHELLGFDQINEADRIRRDLDDRIRALKRPFHVNPDSIIPYRLREALAVAFNKPGLLRNSTRQTVKQLHKKHVCVLRICELDVWLNGKNANNFSLTPVAFRKSITEPGFAPNGY